MSLAAPSSATVSLHLLPGYADAPRIWTGPAGQRRRILDPKWVAKAMTVPVEPKKPEPDLSREWFCKANEAIDDIMAWGQFGSGHRFQAYEIIKWASEFHGVTIKAIKGPSRARKVASARHHAIYEIARLCPHLSLAKIASILGKRDHTTILWALERWPEKARTIGIEPQPIVGRQWKHAKDRMEAQHGV